VRRQFVRFLGRSVLGIFSCAVSLVPVYADDSSSALSSMVSKVHYETLPNGVRVILYNRGIAPVFSGAVVVRVGGSDEVVGETGISHLFEHMAFKGTRSIGTKDFSREQRLLARLEEISTESSAAQNLSPEQKKEWDDIHEQLKELWVSDDFTRQYEQQGAVGQNATTDKEFTKYFVDLPRSAFEFWCRMEADRIMRPVMRQFYQERDVVLEERRMRFDDDPGGRLYELLLGVAYQRHPYRAPVIGYEKDIRALTATKLDAFRKKYYVPSNIVVSVVGRVTPEEDMKVIKKYFGSIPEAPAVKRDIDVEPEPSGERRLSLKMAASPQIIIAYAKPNYPNADDPPLSVAAEILSGGRVSPLYVELVKRRQLAAAIGHEEGPGLAYPNLLMFAATVKAPHTTDALLSAFDRVIDRFKKNGPTQEQLDMAKRSIGMEYLGHLQSSQSLALDFASSELIYGSWKASVEWYDKMTQVTLEDVKRVSQKYLVDDRRTIATIERETEKR
jgi:predicted Zn-dependent peptidase